MTSPAPRYRSLDVLRGVAILGTLATNIWIFTDPEGLVGYLEGTSRAAMSAIWATIEAVLQQLAQGKFLGLLTLMFGIGLEIQRRSAVRAGRPWPGRYPWRGALLFVDGLLHFLLVVEFDVLMGYAVTGVIVAYLLATSERRQRVTMVVAAAVHLVLLSAGTVLLLVLPPDPAPPPLDPNPYADGSWWDLVLFRVANLELFRLEPVFILALSIAMFLLGAHLVRAGVLEDSGVALRRRLLVLGGAALVVDLALGLQLGGAGLVAARYGTAPLVALGLLALGVEIVRLRPRPGFARRRLTEIGRAALSCYVLQNLVASTLCYGWGFGLAARMTPDQRVLGTIAIYLVVVAVVSGFAWLWLRRFDRGPVELAWRWSYEAIGRRLDAAALSSERDPRPTR